MNVALIAHDNKQELMVQLCIAYCGIFAPHALCAPNPTAQLISEATGLAVEKYMTRSQGGIQQIAAMRLCANAIMQLAIPAALQDQASTDEMILPGGRLYEQREACCRVLDTIEGLSYVKNHAAFYIFPKLDVERFNITDDNKFAFDFLHEKHVMIIPGRGFSWKQPDHFRIVMLPRAEQLADAMEKLKDFLSTYRQD